MPAPISSDLKKMEATLREKLGNSSDLVFRPFASNLSGLRRGLLVHVDQLVHGSRVEAMLRSITIGMNPPFEPPQIDPDPLKNFMNTAAAVSEVRLVNQVDDVIAAILIGEVVLLLDGYDQALVADVRKYPSRGVQEPVTESEVRGPRDGFTEDILTNAALIRKRLRDPNLRLELTQVGRRTQSDLFLIYVEGLAKDDLVAEVRQRLKRIDLDAVIGSGFLEELIQDTPLSPFAVLISTERPDKVCAALLEGRVCLLVDNTPFALLLPVTLWQMLQAPGDYYHQYWAATAFRWVRLLALMLGMTLPAVYVMLGSFHHEMIPTPLALSMAGGREGTPLPVLLETLFMIVMFEVMHEAGLRLPRAVGQTVSIVGALVIGEAAVMAGLVAPATVIVVATAGISAFALPSYSLSLIVRLLRIPLLLLSGTLGVFGFLAGTSALAMHLTTLRSFGTAFLSPMAPLRTGEWQDTFIRMPLWATTRRPHFAQKEQRRRQVLQHSGPPGGSGGGKP